MFLTPWALLSALALKTCNASFMYFSSGGVLNVLSPRQTSISPTICINVCAPVENIINSCTTQACLCTDVVEASLQACIDCAVADNPTAAVIADAKNVTNLYETACLGVEIPVVTVPAVPPDGPVPTVQPTSSINFPPTTTTGSSIFSSGPSQNGPVLTTAGVNTAQTTIRPSSTAASSITSSALGRSTMGALMAAMAAISICYLLF
ncbi:hypothetical protein HYPSUDRAFT_47047 [Hypholoma sublateritium FD-334 SS-4]|uniref:Extracellular membrane protein CFEM domain-containing protein n=1 Tax=Hypholoma sublateritium (strain FD-334 SS-4) TaxID=945553 RepID=A0A0D2NJP5_HYPSF|nr:hypothetical protein HYPSUDRAFT_47047 [Hypholoma sublateritium FD-334 SS-4]